MRLEVMCACVMPATTTRPPRSFPIDELVLDALHDLAGLAQLVDQIVELGHEGLGDLSDVGHAQSHLLVFFLPWSEMPSDLGISSRGVDCYLPPNALAEGPAVSVGGVSGSFGPPLEATDSTVTSLHSWE